jgi:hypothetical protein
MERKFKRPTDLIAEVAFLSLVPALADGCAVEESDVFWAEISVSDETIMDPCSSQAFAVSWASELGKR